MQEKIQIFVPDASYDNGAISSERCHDDLVRKLKRIEEGDANLKLTPLLQANIGSGADWPAFLAEVVPLAPWAGGLALFFAGKKINENLDAWASIGLKIYGVLEATGGWLNRGAAFLVSLAKLKKEVGNIESVEILQYSVTDGRFENDWKTYKGDRKGEICDDLPNEFKGGKIHYYRIKANDFEFEITIYSSDIILSRVRNED